MRWYKECTLRRRPPAIGCTARTAAGPVALDGSGPCGCGSAAITHDFLATMLRTDRPSVGLAAASLQKKQSIEYRWGSVKVVDRKKLEEAACECYARSSNSIRISCSGTKTGHDVSLSTKLWRSPHGGGKDVLWPRVSSIRARPISW